MLRFTINFSWLTKMLANIRDCFFVGRSLLDKIVARISIAVTSLQRSRPIDNWWQLLFSICAVFDKNTARTHTNLVNYGKVSLICLQWRNKTNQWVTKRCRSRSASVSYICFNVSSLRKFSLQRLIHVKMMR